MVTGMAMESFSLWLIRRFYQCCGSVSGSWLNPDPGGQKWPTKIEKKYINFIFWSAGCSLLRAEGVSCSLDVLYGKTFLAVFFFCKFWLSKPWIRIRIHLKCWIWIRFRIWFLCVLCKSHRSGQKWWATPDGQLQPQSRRSQEQLEPFKLLRVFINHKKVLCSVHCPGLRTRIHDLRIRIWTLLSGSGLWLRIMHFTDLTGEIEFITVLKFRYLSF